MSGGRIDAESFEPGEALEDVVAALWTGRWDLRGQEPHVTELLGDPCVHVVFETGDRGHDGRVVGVWTRLWRRELAGRGRVRGIKLRPGAARIVLETPAHELSDTITPFAGHFDTPEDRELVRVVQQTDSDAEAFGALREWLVARRIPEAEADVSLAVALAGRLMEGPELTSVAEFCEVAGLGERPLQRLFRHFVGASPKWVMMRRRIQEATLRIESGAAASLTDLALELGYTDHAHFTRDFKRLVGRTPTDFADAVWR